MSEQIRECRSSVGLYFLAVKNGGDKEEAFKEFNAEFVDSA